MTFRNRLKDPKRMIAFAMLVLAILLPKMIHPTARFGQDWIDAFRGCLFGISIGINLLALPLAARQRSGAK
jgi:hypothetical protein